MKEFYFKSNELIKFNKGLKQMEVIETNGKMYHEEDLERAEKIVLELWENIKEVVSNILETVTALVYTFIRALAERGYTEEQAVEYLRTIIQNE